MKALTVAVTVALTGAAQAAVTIPESCPEGANGNCVRMTKEGELTKLHLSGQGWGPANVDKSVGILNKKEGDDHDLTVIADFETDTNVDVMRAGQAFTKVQGTRTDPTYNATINGNKLYINLREGVTSTVSYKKESMLYSFGGEVAGGSASGGAISNNLVAVKGDTQRRQNAREHRCSCDGAHCRRHLQHREQHEPRRLRDVGARGRD